MYTADISFEIFKYVGLWSPTFFLKKYQLVYHVFGSLVVLIVSMFTISTLLYLILAESNLEEFTESIFYVLAMCAACVKVAIVLFKRNKIIELRNMLLEKNCYPQDETENRVQIKCDEIGRKVTIIFLITVSVTTLINVTSPLMKGSKATLPFKSWTPYKLENRRIFWITYFLQATGGTTTTQIIIAFDSFIVVMMMQLTARLEILVHRIKKFSQFCLERKVLDYPVKQQMILKTWIEHHNFLYLYGKNLNDICDWVFFSQLCSTTIDLCTSTYLLSTVNITSATFWRMVVSLTVITLQICLYCWHGNVIKEKSKEIGYAVYSINWILLPNCSRMNLVHIIRRSEIPIEFTAGKIFPMTIKTFLSILKLSFSIYNFLMQSS